MSASINYKGREDGFTIVELMAAMVISSLVVALVLALYLFAAKIMSSWEKRTDLKMVVDQCEHTIAGDAIDCSAVYQCNDSSLVLKKYPDDTVKYSFSDGAIARNNVAFSPSLSVSRPDTGTRNQVRLFASVLFTVDTSTQSGWPVRFWSIKVVGKVGRESDSTEAQFSTVISSQELLRMDSTTADSD